MPSRRKARGRFQFRSLFCLVALLISGLPAGCQTDSSSPTHLSAVEKAGYEVFVREQCFYHCHFLGSALRRSYNPRDSLAGMPPDLRKTPQRTPDWQRAHLIDPGAVLPESPMPSFRYLSSREIDGLIAFLRNLNRESAAPTVQAASTAPIPATPKGLEGYNAGRALYMRNCMGCHGEWGTGAGAVGVLLSPEPRDFTDTLWMSKQTESYLFSVISGGKPDTAMPAFRDRLSEQERALVLRYIEFFADPVARERMELAAIAPGAGQ
jgi:mono/diheme cytochrome c family protein